MRISKTQQVTELLEIDDIRDALKMLKGFKLGLSKEQKRIIQLAYEMFQSKRKVDFYRSLDIKRKDIFREFCEIVNSIWLKDSNVKIQLESELVLMTNEENDSYYVSKKYIEDKGFNAPAEYSECLNLCYGIEQEERFGKGSQHDFLNYMNGK